MKSTRVMEILFHEDTNGDLRYEVVNKSFITSKKKELEDISTSKIIVEIENKHNDVEYKFRDFVGTTKELKKYIKGTDSIYVCTSSAVKFYFSHTKEKLLERISSQMHSNYISLKSGIIRSVLEIENDNGILIVYHLSGEKVYKRSMYPLHVVDKIQVENVKTVARIFYSIENLVNRDFYLRMYDENYIEILATPRAIEAWMNGATTEEINDLLPVIRTH